MANDDIEPEELDEEVELEADELDLEDDLLVDDDDPFVASDDDETVADEEDDDDDEEEGEVVVERSRKRRSNDDDEDDDDLITPDDVEEDLDKILKDRLASEDVDAEEEEEEVEDRGSTDDGLQPKRPDEQLCTSCFLLVRESAPQCPVGDELCPIFSQLK